MGFGIWLILHFLLVSEPRVWLVEGRKGKEEARVDRAIHHSVCIVYRFAAGGEGV